MSRNPLLLLAILTALCATHLPSAQRSPAFADQPPLGCAIQVLLADGAPAPSATVTLMTTPPDWDGEQAWDSHQFQADLDGRVFIPDLFPGDPDLLLLVSRDGAQKRVARVVEFPTDTDTIRLQLQAPVRVTGEILDDRGRPAANTVVRLLSWVWLPAAGLEKTARTDDFGRFEITGLVAGALYNITAHQGPEDAPTLQWYGFAPLVHISDTWQSLGILIPSQAPSWTGPPRGRIIATYLSGPEDEWYDVKSRRWRPAAETFDPSATWCLGPQGATWVWNAARPRPIEERYGATYSFRRRFAVPVAPPGLLAYLTIAADDHVAIEVNGKWVGQWTNYMTPGQFLLPPDSFAPGRNELRLTVRNGPGGGRDYYNPGGVAYALELIAPR